MSRWQPVPNKEILTQSHKAHKDFFVPKSQPPNPKSQRVATESTENRRIRNSAS